MAFRISSAELDRQYRQNRNDIEALHGRLDDMETRLHKRLDKTDKITKDTREKLYSLDTTVVSLNTRVTSLESRFDSLDSKVDSLDSKVDSLDSKVDSLDKKFEDRFDQVDARFAAQDTRFDRLDGQMAEVLDILRNKQAS